MLFFPARGRSGSSGRLGVLSKTVGAGVRLNRSGLHRRGRPIGVFEFEDSRPATGSNLMDLRRRELAQGAGHKERRLGPFLKMGGAAGRNRRICVNDRVSMDADANRRELVERAAKQEMVTELKGAFKAAHTVVVAHYAGLTVSQMQVLRKQAKLAGTKVKVAKNQIGRAHV